MGNKQQSAELGSVKGVTISCPSDYKYHFRVSDGKLKWTMKEPEQNSVDISVN